MNRKLVFGIIGVILIASLVLLSGCTSVEKGERAQMLDTQKTPTISHSNERDIFMGYLEQVNDPNNIQWIYCFSWDGQLIYESAVMVKTISATKSTEPYERVVDSKMSEDYDGARAFAGYIPGTNQLMNPSGMFGHDTPGVIWLDPQGNYFEWHNGPYFVSNVPIKFDTPVISYQNVDVDLYNRVLKMEEKLRAGEKLSDEDKKWLS